MPYYGTQSLNCAVNAADALRGRKRRAHVQMCRLHLPPSLFAEFSKQICIWMPMLRIAKLSVSKHNDVKQTQQQPKQRCFRCHCSSTQVPWCNSNCSIYSVLRFVYDCLYQDFIFSKGPSLFLNPVHRSRFAAPSYMSNYMHLSVEWAALLVGPLAFNRASLTAQIHLSDWTK